MNISANRLSTFRGPQTTWPYLDDDRYSSPEEFVNAGLYSVPTKRKIDKVQCYMCDTTLADWKPGDSPLERHTRTSTKCPLVLLGFPDDSTSSHALGEDSGLLLKARLLTFTKHQFRPLSDTMDSKQQRRRTTRSSSKQRPSTSAEKLAEAGFTFTPTLEYPDRVKCPYCQYELEDLKHASNPWLQHQQSRPDCLFVTRWRSNMQLTKDGTSHKRGHSPEENTRSSSSVSTPSPKEKRRSNLTASTKATATAATNESAITTESGNNYRGGGVGGVDTTDSINRSIVEDSIWDIGSLASDYRKSTYLIPKRQRKAPSNDTPLVTYSKRRRKTPPKSARTNRPLTTAPTRSSSSLIKPTVTAKAMTPPSSPKQRIETPAQLLTRLQKMPITCITSEDKGKGRALEDFPARTVASRTTRRLGRDSLRLSTKKKPSTVSGAPCSSSSSSTPHASDHRSNSPPDYLLTGPSSSRLGHNNNNTLDLETLPIKSLFGAYHRRQPPSPSL
ncbi:hypothetical protein [Absidia glauca]|uniref:Inhibitor of apoptosis repeat-containing protein n=1 Tax=Absidia glauca TaxID=4829 RepID=A0A163KJQ3_ABSGL|nr:hypothetical protein [Absidia glauca]